MAKTLYFLIPITETVLLVYNYLKKKKKKSTVIRLLKCMGTHQVKSVSPAGCNKGGTTPSVVPRPNRMSHWCNNNNKNVIPHWLPHTKLENCGTLNIQPSHKYHCQKYTPVWASVEGTVPLPPHNYVLPPPPDHREEDIWLQGSHRNIRC